MVINFRKYSYNDMNHNMIKNKGTLGDQYNW